MNEEALKLTLSSSPHAHSPNSTRRIMLDVCIALLPALIGAIVFFGARALTLTALSVAGCVFFEWAYRRIMKKDNTTGDLSAHYKSDARMPEIVHAKRNSSVAGRQAVFPRAH